MAIPRTVTEAAALLGVTSDAEAELVARRYQLLAEVYRANVGEANPVAGQRMAELDAAKALLDARPHPEADRPASAPSALLASAEAPDPPREFEVPAASGAGSGVIKASLGRRPAMGFALLVVGIAVLAGVLLALPGDDGEDTIPTGNANRAVTAEDQEKSPTIVVSNLSFLPLAANGKCDPSRPLGRERSGRLNLSASDTGLCLTATYDIPAGTALTWQWTLNDSPLCKNTGIPSARMRDGDAHAVCKPTSLASGSYKVTLTRHGKLVASTSLYITRDRASQQARSPEPRQEPAAAAPAPVSERVHVVVAGDTLQSIATAKSRAAASRCIGVVIAIRE